MKNIPHSFFRPAFTAVILFFATQVSFGQSPNAKLIEIPPGTMPDQKHSELNKIGVKKTHNTNELSTPGKPLGDSIMVPASKTAPLLEPVSNGEQEKQKMINATVPKK